MLLKSRIAKFAPHSSEWFNARVGKLTGSKSSLLAAPKGLGQTGRTYIRRKAAELVHLERLPEGERALFTGFDIPIDNFATTHGNKYEPDSLAHFKKYLEEKLGYTIIFIRPSVIELDSLYTCTPDAFIIMNQKLITDSQDTGYFGEPVEAKCLQVDGHLELLTCKTPQDLKQIAPEKYWQTITEIEYCGSTKGHFIAYHPEFIGGMRFHHIEFRKVDLIQDFKFLNTRREEARILFNEDVEYFRSK